MRVTAWVIGLVALVGGAGAGAEGIAVGEWSVQGGVFRAANPGRALYYLTDQPYITGEGVAEATVIVKKRPITGGWAASGVLISSEPQSFWTLTLVEAPDGTRYTELIEDYQGIHQAQSGGITRLTATEGGFGGAWEYGKAYRMRLELKRDRVEGEITDVATGKPLVKQGWLFGGAPALREGWATLRNEQLEAEFSDVKVTAAAPVAASATAREYPQGARGCAGLYLGDDLPGAETAPKLDALAGVLKQAGLSVVRLNSADMAAEGALAFPGLRYLIADLRRLPAPAMLPLRRWMQQGGTLVSLTAPAFGSFLWPGQGGWLTWEQYTQEKLQGLGRDARPIIEWSPEELPHWEESLGGNVKAGATERMDGQSPDGKPAMTITLPHFDSGWWALARNLDTPPAKAGERLICFWAKSDGKTPELSLEWAEKDGSRWVAVFTLTPEWRYYVLPPQSFAYWPDNPSKGRGGPGDGLHLENVASLHWAISGTHTPGVLGSDAAEHHITLGPIALASATPQALADLASILRPEMESLSPGYKLFEIKGATRWEPTPVGKLWGMSGQWPAPPAYGAVERPGGEGFNRGRWWRWVPLVRAVDAKGRDLGAPVSLVLGETLPLPRCAWISTGALHTEDLARPELQAAIGKAVERLSAGPVLFEGGADRFLARPDEPITVGARVVNHSGLRTENLVLIQITGPDGRAAAPRAELNVDAGPREMAVVSKTLAPLPPGDYTVTTTLVVQHWEADRISHTLTVRAQPSAPPPAGDLVRRKGGKMTLGGKLWHPVGANYWPHCLGGIPSGAYGTGWLDPLMYDPKVVEADLAQMESWGFQAVAGIGADTSWGTTEDNPTMRNLQDFLWRAQRHHIKVILFVAGLDPRGRNDEGARRVIRAVRGYHAIAGYDIAWEPGYWDTRKLYAPQWRDWLVQQYGSLEKAEATLGYALPRDAQGDVDVPPDAWFDKEGPWKAIAAAYRAYMDLQLGIEYRHSVAVVRSVDTWHMIGFRGSNVTSPVGFKPVEQPSVLHFMDWAGPEGYDVPAYGRLTPWPQVSNRGLCTRMLSYISGGKPVVWMEFGMPIYPNGTDWKDEMVHFTPAKYQYQADEGREWWQMEANSGAWGSFVWWYPGGFRVGENSDCGLVDPNNTPRPVADVARQFMPKFAHSETRKADAWLEFKPESNPGGWVGEYLRLRDEYHRLAEQGKNVDVRTAGQTMTSTNCPLIDMAGGTWPGAGPLRYLNAVFERLRIRVAGGQWQEIELPTAPGKAVEVTLPRGKAVDIEAWAGNLGEAKWLRGNVKLSIGGAESPLKADTAFQGSGHFPAARVTEGLEGTMKLRLQVGAAGRARFGEALEVELRGEG